MTSNLTVEMNFQFKKQEKVEGLVSILSTTLNRHVVSWIELKICQEQYRLFVI